MPTPIDRAGRTPNLHTVYMHGQPLGVECRSCGHRALAFADKIDECRADMTELRDLRFKCSACGSRDWRGWLFFKTAEAEAWLEGLVVSPIGDGRPGF